MPATAGRVRMPANNRVHSSAALQTHGIWQSAIGYDPYAPNKEDNKKSVQPQSSSVTEPDGENAYASFQGLLALARITGSNADEARGACKKCGRVGHLTFQCRNFLSIKDDKDPDAIQAAVMSGLEKLKRNGVKGKGRTVGESSEESSEEEESEGSDSDYNSDIERAIAQKFGKKVSNKVKSSSKKKDLSSDDESGSEQRKKRGRSKKRRSVKKAKSDSDDEDEGGRRRKKEKRRRKDESSDEDRESRRRRRKHRKDKRRRRRSHRHSDESEESEESPRRHKRKTRRAASPSDSDASISEDSRVGRYRRRSERSRKRHHEDDLLKVVYVNGNVVYLRGRWLLACFLELWDMEHEIHFEETVVTLIKFMVHISPTIDI